MADLSDETWAEAAARIDLQTSCFRAIINAADLLGKDSIDFANACQDGKLLADALNYAAGIVPQGLTAQKLAAIKAKGST